MQISVPKPALTGSGRVCDRATKMGLGHMSQMSVLQVDKRSARRGQYCTRTGPEGVRSTGPNLGASADASCSWHKQEGDNGGGADILWIPLREPGRIQPKGIVFAGAEMIEVLHPWRPSLVS